MKTDINWNEVLINASISAMQGLQESGKLGELSELLPQKLAEYSVKIGKELVRCLKNEIECT